MGYWLAVVLTHGPLVLLLWLGRVPGRVAATVILALGALASALRFFPFGGGTTYDDLAEVKGVLWFIVPTVVVASVAVAIGWAVRASGSRAPTR